MLGQLQSLSPLCLGETGPACHSPRDIPEHSTAAVTHLSAGEGASEGGTAEPARGHRPQALWLRNHLWHKELAAEPGPQHGDSISHRPEAHTGEGARAFTVAGRYGQELGSTEPPSTHTRLWTRPPGSVPLPVFQQQGSLTCHTITGTNPAAQLPVPLLLSDPQGGKHFGSFPAQLSRAGTRVWGLGWTDGAGGTGQRSLLVAVTNSQLRTDPSQVWKTHVPVWPKASCACCPRSTSLSAWPRPSGPTAAEDSGKAEVPGLGMPRCCQVTGPGWNAINSL